MRSVALCTLSLFVMVLVARGFSEHNRLKLESKLADRKEGLERYRSLFDESNKEKTVRELTALQQVMSPASPSINNQERIANDKLPDLYEIESRYQLAFIDEFIDLDHLFDMHQQMTQARLAHELDLRNTEKFSVHDLLFLIINEGLSFTDINEIENLVSYLGGIERYDQAQKYINSSEFLRDVFRYVGVDEDEHYHKESMALKEAPLFGAASPDYQQEWIELNDSYLNEEQQALVNHLMEYRLGHEEIRELVQGYQPIQERY